jgi:AraC family transcriptional regulator
MDQTNSYITQFAQMANAEGKLDAEIFTDMGIKHWSMDKGKEISYQKDDSHTLSIYLKGGEANYRTDVTSSKGAPGKICLMPQGQSSLWQINEKVEFVHLYFSDALLKRYASTSFGVDVRFIELSDLLFNEDLMLQQLFKEYILICKTTLSYSPFFAEQAIYNVMHYLLKNYNSFQLKENKITGGLSPFHIKLIRETIHENLSQKLTIEKLALMTDLSPFHFARMFKLSFGDSPSNYITKFRIDNVKHLLRKNLSLVDISLKTGFSQQSHMTQYFKKFTGLTPAAYRKIVQ